ncbi:U11/U12 small nuclear ribonucleoprotein 48 kDa protein [Fundulus diaphanus]
MSDPVQSETLQDRLDRLQELTEFTEKCQKQLKDIFETLGWSQEHDDESTQEPMEQCPYDPNHMVPVRTMERHKASCSLRKMGYPAEEQEEMYDPSVCYENSHIKSFLMDKSTQQQIILQARSAAPLMKMEGVFWQGQYSGQPVDVPQNHKRAVCDLTVADRLALYDHVVAVLSQQNEAPTSSEDLYVDLVSKLQKDEGQNEPKSHLELMAEMRDYKRRRQSYRAKNVHITKKSYTEVIREVISVHSEELSRQWKEEEEEQQQQQSARSDHSPQSRRLDRRRSKSSESHHSHSKRHRSRERSRDRERKKKKKRKERDSRSPDGRHHDRKKKKKKDDRERDK